MTERFCRATAVVAVASILWTAALMEFDHCDYFFGNGKSETTLAAHCCGIHEIHIPIDQIHICLACAFESQRVSTLPAIPLPDARFEVFSVPAFSSHGRIAIAPYLFSGKRGPPLLYV